LENDKLIAALMNHKETFGYILSSIKGIDPSIVTHKGPLKDDATPFIDTQRRFNPKMKEVVRKEVVRLLDSGIIYQISNSKWVCPAHCIPKHSGLTIIENKYELIPTRVILISGYKMCIDYRKLNKDTIKDHKPLPNME
jgi:hypothetical protein